MRGRAHWILGLLGGAAAGALITVATAGGRQAVADAGGCPNWQFKTVGWRETKDVPDPDNRDQEISLAPPGGWEPFSATSSTVVFRRCRR
jgi:hypothetical protein